MSRIISHPLAKDHRTGLEICKCIQSFLLARQAIIPLPVIPKPAAGRDNQESQDEYGDGGLDLNDPTLLAFLDNIEDRPDENSIADQNASDVSVFSLQSVHLQYFLCRFWIPFRSPSIPASACTLGARGAWLAVDILRLINGSNVGWVVAACWCETRNE